MGNEKIFQMITIPFVSGFIGWITNYVAIKMTFYPIRFWGIPPYLGWQGIIPRKAHKMAGKAVDLITQRLIRVEEIFRNIDPKQMAIEMSPPVRKVTSELVEEVGHTLNPQIWEVMPKNIKKEINRKVDDETENIIEQVVSKAKIKIYEIFDLKHLVLVNLTGENVVNLNEMFQRCGSKEFKFIERSGFYFGFLFGLLQAFIWYIFDELWTLPVMGVIVGYYTNWLALKMIFRPLYEKNYFGFIKYQGLFLKRQKEVSFEFANLVANKILTPKNILNTIIYGKAAENIFKLIQDQILYSLSNLEGIAKPVLSIIIGNEKYEQIKNYILERLTSIVPKSIERVEKYMYESMDLENTLSKRMSSLPPEEFEDLLHSIFKEDEWILITVGAILGAMVGLLQALVAIYI